MMGIEVPAAGTTITVEGGTILHQDTGRFIARTPAGERVYANRRPTRHVPVGFRRAQNALRAAAGLEPLPNLCGRCMKEHTRKSDYCSPNCNSYTPRPPPIIPTASELFFNSLTREEILQRAQAAAGPEKLRGEHVPAGTKTFSYSDLDLRHFTQALNQAEALIKRRGGNVPRRETFWEYLARFQREQGVETEAV